MIYSMTGYGEGVTQDERFTIRVEIKSVNSKNRDIKIRMPYALSHLERDVHEAVKSAVQRGTLSIHASYVDHGTVSAGLSVNTARAARIAELGAQIAQTHGSQPLTTRDILFYQGVIAEQDEGDDSMKSSLLAALEMAIETHRENRIREGQVLQEDLSSHLSVFRENMNEIVAGMADFVGQLRQNHEERIRQLIDDVKIDEARLATEIAMFAERIDISEEVARMGAHLDTLDNMVSQGGAIGKKMDFYLQELNREVNTSLAKLRHINAIDGLLTMKETVEKMREQACNVE